jgi:hypothetical protein
LLLSQADVLCRDDFLLVLNQSFRPIVAAIHMLQAENNGRRKEAQKLLLKLGNTGRFANLGLLMPRIRPRRNMTAAQSVEESEKAVSESQSAGAPADMVPLTPDSRPWYRRLFASLFHQQSADRNDSPPSAAVEQSAPGLGRPKSEMSLACGQPLVELPVIDINWFKGLSNG